MYGYQGGFGPYSNQMGYQTAETTPGPGGNVYNQQGTSIYGNSYGYTHPVHSQQAYNNPYNYNTYAPPPPPPPPQANAYTFPSKNQHSIAANGYSTYDAAVYAAANSYLTKSSNPRTWTGARGDGVSGGRFIKKNAGKIGGNDPTQYYCEICKISCAGTITYNEHLMGKNHKKREAMQKGEKSVPLAKNRLSYRCNLCNVTCSAQDSYTSHVRGKQHMKAVTVCRKMGKVVPEDVPTIISTDETGAVTETKAKSNWHQQQLSGTKRVIGVNTINFQSGTQLNTIGKLDEKQKEVEEAVGSAGKPTSELSIQKPMIEVEDETIKAMMAAEEVKPIGEEFIDSEVDGHGKLIQYICKLCNCKFSDPNAKEVHLKGRRHRTSYKQKIDSTIIVDQKQLIKRHQAKNRKIGGTKPKSPILRTQWFGPPTSDAKRFEVLDERHFDEKHKSLDPGQEEVTKMEKLLHSMEKTLKMISEEFEKDRVIDEEQGEKKEELTRILQGVMRVGIVSKNTFIKGDDLVELVVICTPAPTSELLQKVLTRFNELSDSLIAENDVDSPICFVVKWKNEEGLFRCRCIMTSPSLRERTNENSNCPDLITGQLALAYLRQSKWFGTKLYYLQSCQQVLRILRDLKKRDEVWRPLSDYTIELIVEKVLTSCAVPLNPTEAFKRFLEAISVGIMFSTIIYDPCEKEKKNIFLLLDDNYKHSVTTSAQTYLRLMAFNQIYKVLGMERLSDIRPSLTNDRKRAIDENKEANDVEVKKEKIEENEINQV